MTKREKRIIEIMTEECCDHDTAELIFADELERLYPDFPDGEFDVREMMFETED